MTGRSLLTPTPAQQQLGITILRIVVGVVFTAHGAQKLFSHGLAAVTDAFAKMGVPMPGLVSPFVALLEFFGGLALVVGLFTRLAALGLAFNMLGAILLVHLAAGFFLPTGYEYALTLFAASLTIVAAGPGALSIDAVLAARRAAAV